MPRLRFSLFAKLSLIAAGTVVAIGLVAGAALDELFREGQEHGWTRKVVGYVRFIGDDVFRAPSAERIEQVAGRLELDMRYEGPGLTHSTGAMPAIDELLEDGRRRHRRHHWGHRRHMPNDILPVAHGGRFYVLHFRPPHRLAIGVGGGFDHMLERAPWLVAGALALIALVVGCAYLLMRRMLSPLRDLEGRQAALARGEWPDEMRVSGTDEIGRLAEGFNRMQRQIRSTIKAKEQLLADISHEFRTPLTRMKVVAEMVDDRKARERLSADIAELDGLTEEILEGARLQAGAGSLRRERCAVGALLKEVLANYGEREREHLSLEDGTAGLEIEVDPRLAKRAIRNIVDNSLKHSELAPGSVRVRAFAEGDRAVVEVSDRGPGVPAEEVGRLFDSFYRADKSRSRKSGGYGLGMRMCKLIVEAHGGSVSAHSGQGQGLTVRISLPLRSRD